MKRKMTLFIAAFAVAALCFAACGHEGGNEEEEGGGGSINQEYPSTADVIRNAVTDIDGNKYDAVRIGNQVWMASNLRTTRYPDGTAIPLGEALGELYSFTDPYRYAPGTYGSNEDNMINVPAYGYLYNWAAVMHGAESSESNPSGVQGICPKGWHVPSDKEWTQLKDYMKTRPEYMSSGNSNYLAKALAATWGWRSSSEPDDVGYEPSTTNNATGFSALPAGLLYYDFDNDISGSYYGNYIDFGHGAYFWSSTEKGSDGAWFRYLYYMDEGVYRHNNDKFHGFSVRCVRD